MWSTYTNGDRFTGSGPNRTRKRGRSEFNHGGCSAVGPVAVAVEATGPVSDNERESMTVDEIEAVIESVSRATDKRVVIGRNDNGTWFAWLPEDPMFRRIDYKPLPEVIAKLREWATPPKPATLTIEVPFSWVENRANGGGGLPQYKEQVDAACREAFSPWTQS